ncbi:MAG TPA: BACON domain-containing carbohydrate-binding protein [Vicinamibacterales bacterium]|nr:BACON domain-containing carbohydrate-binding protein [Vicinamibacterales bacterium]
MFKLTSALLFLSLSMAACSDSSDSPSSPTSPTPPAQTTCTFTISTTSFSLAGAGATASFSVNTGSTCAWTVTNNSQGFVSLTGSTSQTGPGTVNFTVAENTGAARTGSLTVAGQTISISQAEGDPLFGNWRGTIAKGAGCPATLPASVEWTGTFRRTSLSTTELVISIPSVLVFNQVIPVTFNGNNLSLGVQIDTLYSFAATLAGDRRSFNGTFTGGSCSGTWTGTRQ